MSEDIVDDGGLASEKTLLDENAQLAALALRSCNKDEDSDWIAKRAYADASSMITEKRKRVYKLQEIEDGESSDYRWRTCPYCHKWAMMPVIGERHTDKRKHLKCGNCGHGWYAKPRKIENVASRSTNHRRSNKNKTKRILKRAEENNEN